MSCFTLSHCHSKLFLENLEFLVTNIIKKQNLNVKYQVKQFVEIKKETPNEFKSIFNWFNSGKFVAHSKNYFDTKIYSKLSNIIMENIKNSLAIAVDE